jgi:hypothetical protein
MSIKARSECEIINTKQLEAAKPRIVPRPLEHIGMQKPHVIIARSAVINVTLKFESKGLRFRV